MKFNIESGKNKEEKKEPTTEEKLAGLGIDVIHDRRFDDRIKYADLEYKRGQNLLSDDQIDRLTISQTKKNVLKEVEHRREYLFKVGTPYAAPRNDPWFYKAHSQVVDLLLMCRNLCFSSTSDDATESLAHDYLSRVDVLVPASFSDWNVTPQKAIVIQTLQKKDNRYGGQEEDL